MVFFLGTFAKQSKLIHDSLDTLVICLKATVQKLPMYPSYAISFPVFIKDTDDFGRQISVSLLDPIRLFEFIIVC